MSWSIKESVGDVFRWKKRTVIQDEYGNETVAWEAPRRPRNPISMLGGITLYGWASYLIGLAAWTADAMDFHVLATQQTKLAKHFGTSKTQISEAITYTLLLRSVGAIVFGLIADKFGRKYPLVINLWVLGALQVGSIFAGSFNNFLACRALFGLAMGGIYGAASAMALEPVPSEARGFLSGLFQAGYSIGYVIAACVNLAVGNGSWKIAFWVGAAMSFSVGFLRLALPESKQFIEARKASKAAGKASFRKTFPAMLKKEWRVCVFAIILMSWFNWYSHSSQDAYTTFMLVGKKLSTASANRASIIMKTGAIFGGVMVGYSSQWFGRRRAMIVSAIIATCLIPAWVLPTTESGLMAGGFMIQFFIQGAWGCAPAYLNEIAPPAFRSLFTGTVYQLGNAISSPSTQLVNALSESHLIRGPNGSRVEAYGPVMAIATAIIGIGLASTALFGPENKDGKLENADKDVIEQALPTTAAEKNADADNASEAYKTQSRDDEKDVAELEKQPYVGVKTLPA